MLGRQRRFNLRPEWDPETGSITSVPSTQEEMDTLIQIVVALEARQVSLLMSGWISALDQIVCSLSICAKIITHCQAWEVWLGQPQHAVSLACDQAMVRFRMRGLWQYHRMFQILKRPKPHL